MKGVKNNKYKLYLKKFTDKFILGILGGVL